MGLVKNKIAKIGKIPNIEKKKFIKALITYLDADISVEKSLSLILRFTKHSSLKTLVKKTIFSVKKGKSLSSSLASFKSVFPNEFIQALILGETSGDYAEPLKKYLVYYEKVEKAKNKTKSALVYPAFILIFSLVVVFVFVSFIMPVFSEIFNDFGGKIPSIANFFIKISSFINSNLALLFFTIILVFLLIKKKQKAIKKIIYSKVKKVPYIGTVINNNQLSMLCLSISSMLGNGLPLYNALQIVYNNSADDWAKKEIGLMKKNLLAGKPITYGIDGKKIFTDFAIQMINIGEQSSNLQQMFESIANYYEEEVNTKSKSLLSLMEPILVSFIGIIVGIMLISFYLPLFDLFSTIGG